MGFLGGILAGAGQAAQQRNLMDVQLQHDTNEHMAQVLEMMAQNVKQGEDPTPYLQAALQYRSTPPGKKPPDINDFIKGRIQASQHRDAQSQQQQQATQQAVGQIAGGPPTNPQLAAQQSQQSGWTGGDLSSGGGPQPQQQPVGAQGTPQGLAPPPGSQGAQSGAGSAVPPTALATPNPGVKQPDGSVPVGTPAPGFTNGIPSAGQTQALAPPPGFNAFGQMTAYDKANMAAQFQERERQLQYQYMYGYKGQAETERDLAKLHAQVDAMKDMMNGAGGGAGGEGGAQYTASFGPGGPSIKAGKPSFEGYTTGYNEQNQPVTYRRMLYANGHESYVQDDTVRQGQLVADSNSVTGLSATLLNRTGQVIGLQTGVIRPGMTPTETSSVSTHLVTVQAPDGSWHQTTMAFPSSSQRVPTVGGQPLQTTPGAPAGVTPVNGGLPTQGAPAAVGGVAGGNGGFASAGLPAVMTPPPTNTKNKSKNLIAPPSVLPHVTGDLGPSPGIWKFENPLPTSMTRGAGEQGDIIIKAGDNLKAEIEANRAKLGNLSSYWNTAVNNTPIADPAVSHLMTSIGSFAALNPRLHGFRGSQALAEFSKLIGGVPKNPDALIAAINGIQDTARVVAQRGAERPGQLTPPPAGGAGGGPQNDPAGIRQFIK